MPCFQVESDYYSSQIKQDEISEIHIRIITNKIRILSKSSNHVSLEGETDSPISWLLEEMQWEMVSFYRRKETLNFGDIQKEFSLKTVNPIVTSPIYLNSTLELSAPKAIKFCKHFSSLCNNWRNLKYYHIDTTFNDFLKILTSVPEG